MRRILKLSLISTSNIRLRTHIRANNMAYARYNAEYLYVIPHDAGLRQVEIVHKAATMDRMMVSTRIQLS
jgi:hypothetical protein